MTGAMVFAIGAAGALAGELLKLYEFRGKLSPARFKRVSRSPVFWTVTIGMLAASGFVAWAVNGMTAATPFQVMLSGIGARGILSGATAATIANTPPKMGEGVGSLSARDLF